MSRRRLPWIVLLAALLVAAVLIFGPLWDLSSGQGPLQRPPGLNYGVAIQLGLVTVGMVLVVVGTMTWAGTMERASVGRARARRRRAAGAPH